MANRVIAGPRSNGDGIFISQPSQDASSATNTVACLFNSNTRETARVVGYGQSSLDARTTGDWTFDSPKTIYTNNSSAAYVNRHYHGLGYAPLVFLRWSYNSPTGGDVALDLNKSPYLFAVTAYPPARSVSRSIAYQVVNFFTFNFWEANDIGYGCDIEVDSDYLYVASYESGAKGMNYTLSTPNTTGTIEDKFDGLDIVYGYVIMNSPSLGVNI